MERNKVGTITLRILKDNVSACRIDTTNKLLLYLENCAKQTGLSYRESRDEKRTLCGTEYSYRCRAHIEQGNKLITTYHFTDDSRHSPNSWELFHRGVALESCLEQSMEISPKLSSILKIKHEILRKYVAVFYDNL